MAKKSKTVKKMPIKKAKRKSPLKITGPKTTDIIIHKSADNRLSDQTLSLANPNQIMGFSKTLKEYITKNNLSVNIQGNDYAMVDGWKFAGANFGLTAIPEDPEPIHEKGRYIVILFKIGQFFKKEGERRVSYEKEYAFFSGYMDDSDMVARMKKDHPVSREIIRPFFSFKCRTSIRRIADGVEVGRGSSICTNLEVKKAEFDEYSVQSMSQTRSIGKAYRNLIGYVMKAAGIEPTPAEEMPDPDQTIAQDGAAKNKRGPSVPLKPIINQFQFGRVMDRIVGGEKTILKSTREAFTMTPEQDEALQQLHDKYC